MRRGAALLVSLTLASGCGTREHSNPFDPENPATRGRPANFAAVAGWKFVSLRWTTPDLGGEFGYRLFRRVAGESDFRMISEFGRTATGYLDLGLTDATIHEYRLFYVFSGVSGGLPAEDRATPGPLLPWFADLSRGTLVGTTPDGRHVVHEASGFEGPTYVAVDPTRGMVWVSDTYAGRVVLFDPSRSTRINIPGQAEPVAIALDPIDRSAWVCDQALDAVFHYASNTLPGTPAVLTGIQTPIGIATDPGTGTVWVCERGANQMRRYTRAGVEQDRIPLVAPSRVAVDSLTKDGWVTCFDVSRLVHIDAAGIPQDTLPLSGPIGVAVDHRRGRIWVANARGNEVVALDRAGTIEFRVVGLSEARDVAVDGATGEAWATAPGFGEVVRISAAGVILERLRGGSYPYTVALDPGVR